MDKEVGIQSNVFRSHSTSTNSLFSLKSDRSYSSILEYYETASAAQNVITGQWDTLEEEEEEEAKSKNMDADGGQTCYSDSSDGKDDATLELRDQRPLTLNYVGRHGSRAERDMGVARVGEKDKFLFILVGLPATGKSTIAGHLIRFLQSKPLFTHLRCGIFNAGQVRRKLTYKNSRSMQLANSSKEDLFNPMNADKKNMYARITLERLFKELDADLYDIAIFDATNSTIPRRSYVFEEVRKYNSDPGNRYSITPIVLQVTCDNRNFIRFNIHNKTFNQDYFDKPYEYAVRDFARRLRYYYSQFVPFTKREFNQMREDTLQDTNPRSVDSGLFFFHIVNAGLDTCITPSLLHYPDKVPLIVAQVVDVIEDFVNRYSQMYGSKYIESANRFIKGESNAPISSSTTSVVELVVTSARTPYLSTLFSVIDEQYFSSLNAVRTGFESGC